MTIVINSDENYADDDYGDVAGDHGNNSNGDNSNDDDDDCGEKRRLISIDKSWSFAVKP